MARKRYSDEDALKILREIDVHLHDGLDVVSHVAKRGFRTRRIITGVRSLVALAGRTFQR